jgi:hypothetical protein
MEFIKDLFIIFSGFNFFSSNRDACSYFPYHTLGWILCKCIFGHLTEEMFEPMGVKFQQATLKRVHYNKLHVVRYVHPWTDGCALSCS